MVEAAELPFPLATRLAVLENLVSKADPQNCGALRDVETIVADTLSLIENSLSIEAAAQAAILDCLALADELMRVGVYWGDPGDVEPLRAQAIVASAGSLRRSRTHCRAKLRGLAISLGEMPGQR